MDDTIYRRDAIDAVEHITSSMSVCINSDECHGMKRMQRQAVIELANLPSAQQTTCKYWDAESDFCTLYRPSAQPEQRWIPWDSGRLPDDSGTYIVTTYDGVQERVTFAKYQKRLKRWELTGARAYWRVLAWMPLPEPYAERREE